MSRILFPMLVGLLMLARPVDAGWEARPDDPAPPVAGPSASPAGPQVKVVALEPGEQPYFLLLSGPPETRSMKSGLVTLAPGKSIGLHNTRSNEEMIIPLEGQGELRLTGRDPLVLKPGLVTYAPPHTEHDVINTGGGQLRYIFIVARAE
jgi:quercetin dioxygenase-like cupin family protein